MLKLASRAGKRLARLFVSDRTCLGGAYSYGTEIRVAKVMPRHRSTAIANEFLRQPGALNHLTQMQLQKLVFIANGFSFALGDDALVAEPFKAWDLGPVETDLRNHTRFYGGKPITKLIKPSDNGYTFFFEGVREEPPYKASLNDFERRIIENVYRRYGSLSGIQLSKLTHQPRTPWHIAYSKGKNTPIIEEDIRKHYRDIVDRIAA